MYKHILVAVDGSDTSNLALQEAIRLAKDQKAALRLVHVVDEAAAYMELELADQLANYQKAIRERGQKVLSICAAVVREAGLEVDTKVKLIDTLDHRIYDAIEKEAKEWPADLIVLGTHGRRSFRHLILGSVAEGVLRVATKPVLIIPIAQGPS
jgi:nucleotide-binding universal stress UspA family protein